MPRKLVRMKINRVDLVDKGANQHASIVLFKRDVKKDSPSLTSIHVEAPPILPEPPKAPKKKPKKESQVGKELMKRFLALFGETDVEKRNTELALLTKAVEEEKDTQIDKATMHDASDPNCKCADCMAKSDSDIAKKFVDLQKQNADLVKAAADLKKTADDAMAQVTIEKDARLDREMVDILKSFKATPLNIDMSKADNDVVRFRKMRASDPDTFNRTMDILKAADAQIIQSGLYGMRGTSRSGEGDGSAWAKIEAKAEALIEKSATPMTREVAINKAMEQNPKLVAEYRAEQQ